MSKYLPTVFGENLMDVFDDFDRDFFRGFGNIDRTLYGKHAQHVKKDEIHLELNDGYLTISTEKSLEKDEENKKGKMLRQERYAGVMQRSFYVGKNLTEEDIKASYESGVLHVSIPKKDAPKAHEKKTILIEG